jgi:hypothetical protein
MKNNTRYFFTPGLVASILIVLVVTSGQSQNSSSPGGSAGTAMSMGFGARGIAMGNSLTAVISGDLQSYYNPAVIPFQAYPVATIAYSVLSLDRRLNYLSYTNSIKPNAGISLSIINAGTGEIDGRDNDGVHTQTLSTSENSFMLSFGLKPDPNYAFGVTAKVLYYSLYEGIKSTTAAMDVGAIFILPWHLTLGAVIQDIGAKYKWDTSKLYGVLGNATTERFLLRKRVGLSWLSMDYIIIVSSELERIGHSTYLRFGSEIEVYDGVHIRGGIDQIAVNTDEASKPSVGLSFQAKSIELSPTFQYSYIFEPYSPSGIHILSLSLRFK